MPPHYDAVSFKPKLRRLKCAWPEPKHFFTPLPLTLPKLAFWRSPSLEFELTGQGELEQFERELKELNSNDENLKRQELELTELRAILSNTSTFFEEVYS